MEKILSKMGKKVDSAELYHYRTAFQVVKYENGKLNELDSSIQSGYSLRILKNKTLGFAYTKNLINPDKLIDGALDSLKANIKTNFKFPSQNKIPRLNTYNPEIEQVNSLIVTNECRRINEFLRTKLDSKIDISAEFGTINVNIQNTRGLELNYRASLYILVCSAIFPNTASGLHYIFSNKSFSKVNLKMLNKFAEFYQMAKPIKKLKSGRMKVLFLPATLYVLLWRLGSGTNGSNIYYKKSPLVNKLNEKIFSEKLTIYDDPLNDEYPLARAFDDEGTSCRKLMIVENGILKNFYYDLFYADKMGVSSTGNGFKSATWGSEIAALKPTPSLENIFIKPGNKSLNELISSIDRGIIVGGVLGAHSGNIINGDFSVGIEPCIYVEKGEILCRVKNTMIAGNIYEVMKNVVDVENELHPVFMFGKALPAILFDDIMVISSK
uniref:TldD/PmbA family protein n=1 Tax=candidate division WOR-3 bacterium TaxID=2052148 RepID=A0A7C4XL26_UNCW3